jgi:hypothetical protein
MFQALKLGADGVCIGSLFAVCAESDLSGQEKMKFADAAEQPRVGHAWATHMNPDGSEVKLGDADAFGSSTSGDSRNVLADNRNVLADNLNASAAQIIDEIMNDFHKLRTVDAVSR